MQTLANFIFNAMTHGWGFLVFGGIFGLICYNAAKPRQEKYSKAQIREAEAKLRIKWAQEEAEKQNSSNPSSHSPEDSGR